MAAGKRRQQVNVKSSRMQGEAEDGNVMAGNAAGDRKIDPVSGGDSYRQRDFGALIWLLQAPAARGLGGTRSPPRTT